MTWDFRYRMYNVEGKRVCIGQTDQSIETRVKEHHWHHQPEQSEWSVVAEHKSDCDHHVQVQDTHPYKKKIRLYGPSRQGSLFSSIFSFIHFPVQLWHLSICVSPPHHVTSWWGPNATSYLIGSFTIPEYRSQSTPPPINRTHSPVPATLFKIIV
jgi:hypothetical protein